MGKALLDLHHKIKPSEDLRRGNWYIKPQRFGLWKYDHDRVSGEYDIHGDNAVIFGTIQAISRMIMLTASKNGRRRRKHERGKKGTCWISSCC